IVLSLWYDDQRRPNSVPTRRSSDLLQKLIEEHHEMLQHTERGEQRNRGRQVFGARHLTVGFALFEFLFRGLFSFFLGAVLFRHRSEEHTSELQSRDNFVCRLLLQKN